MHCFVFFLFFFDLGLKLLNKMMIKNKLNEKEANLSKRVELGGEGRDVDFGLEGLRELVKDDLVELEQLLRRIHVGLGKVAFDAAQEQRHRRRTSRSDTFTASQSFFVCLFVC